MSGDAGGSESDPRVGRVLQGRYRILERLAEGGMGTVYRGERIQLGRPVAIKYLHPLLAAQPAFVKRFEIEARAMGRLAHPNCLSVIDFGVDEAPYLVLDYVSGASLRQVIADAGGPLPVGRALAIGRQVLAALAHAHAQGIVHRDIKPDNVVIAQGEGLADHVRILDFGLAKMLDGGPALTAGLALGTPSYMSPEQTGVGTVDERTDVYATGVLLYEMLTGRKPFLGDHPGELMRQHREDPPPPLRAVAPGAGLSPELEAVVLRALAKKSDDRFPSAAAMAEALHRVPEQAAATGSEATGPAAIATAGLPAFTAPLPLPGHADLQPSAAAAPAPPGKLPDATIVDARPPPGALAAPPGLPAPAAGARSVPAPPPRERGAAPWTAAVGWLRADRRRPIALGAGLAIVLALTIGATRGGPVKSREAPSNPASKSPAPPPHRVAPAPAKPAAAGTSFYPWPADRIPGRMPRDNDRAPRGGDRAPRSSPVRSESLGPVAPEHRERR